MKAENKQRKNLGMHLQRMEGKALNVRLEWREADGVTRIITRDEEMMSHTCLPLPQSMIYSEFTHTLEHVYLLTIQNGIKPIVSFQLNDSNIIFAWCNNASVLYSIWSIYCILYSIQSHILSMIIGST